MGGAKPERLRVAILAASILIGVIPGAALGASPVSAPASSHAALPADAISWVVTLKPGHDSDREAPGLAKAAGGKVGQTYRHALNGFAFKGSAKAATALQHNPNVRTVVADGAVKALADTIPTGILRIRANHATQPSAYSDGFTGAGIRVAILDTGIDLTHPDLVPNLDIALGKNCITAGPPQDGHGHGTHVAGIVAAADNGSGIVGVAPHARLVPIKVLDDTGQGEWSNLICAIDYLTGLATDGDPTNDVRVANMSLGDVGSASNCNDGFVRQAICTSTAAGIVYVAAAGNSTVDTSTFIPAAYPEVITVSALTDLDGEPGGQGGCWLFFFFCDDTLAEFSNYGSVVDVTAPGTQIYSSWTGGGYMTEMGTSMAAPHVAGVAALVLAQNPRLQPAAVEALLKTTGNCPNGQRADATGAPNCTGKGQWGNDPDGYGEPIVNALAASQDAGGDSRPDIQITSPTNGATVSGIVPVTANATDDLGVVKVDFSVSGVHAATDTNGADGWSMLWNTTTIAGGVYTLSATATDTTGHTRTDSVTVTAGTNLQGDWVGAYGTDGYILGAWNGTSGDVSVLPAGVTYTLEQGLRHSWSAATTDVRALESASQTERRATTWYDATQVRVRLNFAAAYTGTLHLYALDFDTTTRRETVTVNDGSGPRSLALSTTFNSGAWLHFPISVPAGGSVVITAVNNAGTSTNAVVAGVFLGGAGTAATAPGAPTDLEAIPGDGIVALLWSPPVSDGGSPITGYTATASPGGATCTASAITICAIGGLTNGQTYTFTVTATNAVGTGPASAPVTATPVAGATPPGAPTGLIATAGNGMIGLSWTAPASDGGSPIVGYQIYRGMSSGTEIVLTASDVPSYTDEDVVNGTTYWYQVSAVTAAGEGPLSTEQSATPNGAAPVTPDAPTGLIATAGNTQVGLTWTAPASDGGSSIVGYTAAANPGGATCTTAGTTACTITGLTNGTAYSFTVTATNAVGTGAPSTAAVATPATVPDAPTGLIATAGNAQVGLTWTAPASNGGSSVTGYTVTASPGGATCTTAGATNCTVTGLTNGALYSFTVTATNAVGTGPASSSASATPATVAGAPTGLIATRGNAQVALSWTAPASNGGSSITGYSATASPGGATCTTTGTTSCAITGLTNGTSYSFTVSATNAVGTGAASTAATATPATMPGAPTGLTATAANAQVGLDWTAPASNGGSSITGYTVTASPGGATCTTAGATNCTITGLTNGTLYSFTVTATNAVGTGAASAPATATPATVPGAPTGLTATAGNAQVALSWTAPASNGGSSITGYTATASPGGATCETAGATNCTVTGLTNGTLYSFTVKATNAVGSSVASTAASATPSTVPGAPTGLSATPGNVTVGLTWSAPASNGGSPITGYKVYRSTSSGTETLLATIGNVLTYTDNAVVNGTTYFYQVSAINARGDGARSTETSAKPATVPGAPRNLSAKSRQAGGVSLSWAAPLSNGGSAITNYRIYRSTSSGAEVFLVAVGNVTSYIDTATTRNVRYYYTVSAVNAIGEGVKSTESSAIAK